MPDPDIAALVQPERYSMLQPEALTIPDDAIALSVGALEPTEAETAAPAGSDADDTRLGSADAQVQAADTIVERRSQHLIEHDAGALLPMLDREEAAVRQHAHRKANGVGNIAEAEITVAGRSADAVDVARHSCSPHAVMMRPPSPVVPLPREENA